MSEYAGRTGGEGRAPGSGSRGEASGELGVEKGEGDTRGGWQTRNLAWKRTVVSGRPEASCLLASSVVLAITSLQLLGFLIHAVGEQLS